MANQEKLAASRSGSSLRRWSIALVPALVALFAISSQLRVPGWASGLPSTYAICSNQGSTIYTGQASDPSVGCFVVENGLIADRGTLGEIRHRWGDYQSYGSLFKRGLKIKHVSKGAVIPGLAVGPPLRRY
jgi:hypothetical protein